MLDDDGGGDDDGDDDDDVSDNNDDMCVCSCSVSMHHALLDVFSAHALCII